MSSKCWTPGIIFAAVDEPSLILSDTRLDTYSYQCKGTYWVGWETIVVVLLKCWNPGIMFVAVEGGYTVRHQAGDIQCTPIMEENQYINLKFKE